MNVRLRVSANVRTVSAPAASASVSRATRGIWVPRCCGFGESVPAFMLIRRRGSARVVEDMTGEDVEAPDVIHEENGGNAES